MKKNEEQPASNQIYWFLLKKTGSYLICKMHEDKKIEIMNIQCNSLTQCTVKFLHLVIEVILKLFCLKLSFYLFTQFLYYN